MEGEIRMRLVRWIVVARPCIGGDVLDRGAGDRLKNRLPVRTRLKSVCANRSILKRFKAKRSKVKIA